MLTHLGASEGWPETRVHFLASFLWESWNPWDPRSPSLSSSTRPLGPGHPTCDGWGPGLEGYFTLSGTRGQVQGRVENGLGESFSSTRPHRSLYGCTGHQSHIDEGRGYLSYLSVVLIRNLWGSCSWLT